MFFHLNLAKSLLLYIYDFRLQKDTPVKQPEQQCSYSKLNLNKSMDKKTLISKIFSFTLNCDLERNIEKDFTL